MNTFYPQNLSLSQLRQLPQERMHVKMYKNEEITLTPQSNRSQLNEAIENLEMQWQSIRRQHLEQRSCSRSPAKNNLMNQLLKNKDKQQQCILKKVVPLSTINLARIQDQQQQQQIQYNPQQSAQRNHLKDSSHFQYIANKYCNIYRRPSPEQQYLVNSLRDNEQMNYSIGRNQLPQQQYQRNNLKMLDERVRVNSQDKYAAQALSNSNILKKDGPQRKRVSQYTYLIQYSIQLCQRFKYFICNFTSILPFKKCINQRQQITNLQNKQLYYKDEENKMTSVKSAAIQNQRIVPKKRP